MAISEASAELAQQLYDRTPQRLWHLLLEALEQAASGASIEQMLQHLPLAMDADLYWRMKACLEHKPAALSWQAFGYSLQLMGETLARERQQRRSELLWTGPAVASLPLRSLDQAFYDGLEQARARILLVTFAATRIKHFNDKLEQALDRGVVLRLLLESREASQGQLRFDAAKAFSRTVKQHAAMYCWASQHRLRNQRGDPAKLHAKFAVIDDCAYVSSANLTGDAFERNMELGVLLRDHRPADTLWQLVDSLLAQGILEAVPAAL